MFHLIRRHKAWSLATVLFTLLMVAGAVAKSPEGDSDDSPVASKEAGYEEDPRDPTPDTPGRLTAEEEDAFVDCFEFASANTDTMFNGPASALIDDETKASTFGRMFESCFTARGYDIADVRRRNEQQKADGY